MGVDCRNHLFAPGLSPGWRLPVIECPPCVAGLLAVEKVLVSVYFWNSIFVMNCLFRVMNWRFLSFSLCGRGGEDGSVVVLSRVLTQPEPETRILELTGIPAAEKMVLSVYFPVASRRKPEFHVLSIRW